MATDKKQKRVKIPGDIQSRLLLANRHACCVCQKPKVHIHHIDEDPSNNHISNLAILCVDCHAIASMKMGMNKKISSVDVKKYKATWELKCANDIEYLVGQGLLEEPIQAFAMQRGKRRLIELSSFDRAIFGDVVLQ